MHLTMPMALVNRVNTGGFKFCRVLIDGRILIGQISDMRVKKHGRTENVLCIEVDYPTHNPTNPRAKAVFKFNLGKIPAFVDNATSINFQSTQYGKVQYGHCNITLAQGPLG